MNYSIRTARYAKNSIAVNCPSNDGYKTREARIVEALNGRWSNREKAYILAASKEERLRRLITEQWDARLSFDDWSMSKQRTRMILEPPPATTLSESGQVMKG